MRGSLRVGSVAGIPILVSPSWLLIFGLFTYILATQIFPDQLEEMSTAAHIALAAISVILFFFGVILHELAHALVARLYRIPVTNITLFLFGGVAQISREAKRASAELLIAVVGPLTSLALGAVTLGLWFLLRDQIPDAAELILIWLTSANLVLGIFNLLPAFPMDGGRIFRSLLWMTTGNYYRSSIIAAWTGRIFYWAIIAIGVLSIAGFDMIIAEGVISGIWFILIGFMLDSFARQSLVQSRLLHVLDGFTATDVMQTDLPTVSGGTSLGILARGAFQINPRLTYFVEDNGRLTGILTMLQVFSVPEYRWDAITVGDAMLPSGKLRAVSPGDSASDILIEMEAENLSHMPVVQDGRVLGLVGRDGILRALRGAFGPTFATS